MKSQAGKPKQVDAIEVSVPKITPHMARRILDGLKRIAEALTSNDLQQQPVERDSARGSRSEKCL